MRMRSWPLFTAACCLLMSSLVFGAWGGAARARSLPAAHAAAKRSHEMTGYLRLGQAVPNVKLSTLTGTRVVALSAFIGKGNRPLIINAWASWCPPCQEETPGLVRLYKANARSVNMIGVNLTSMDSRTDARAFVRRYHVPYPVLLDPQGVFRFAYAVIAEPMTYVVSKSGKLLAVYIGAMNETRMKQMIRIAVSEKPMNR